MKADIVSQTEAFVREALKDEVSRDWWHVYRVRQNALQIARQEEQADMLVVELAALLHDLAHWQLTDGDEQNGPYKVADFLLAQQLSLSQTDHILQIIRDTKYKGAAHKPQLETLEAKIIFDADKLDSLGAVGIAKTFTYGGLHHRAIHDPAVEPTLHATFEGYKQNESTSVNHFYEKNLLLRDWMQTKTGRAIAERRHAFLEAYLEEFYAEWQGAA